MRRLKCILVLVVLLALLGASQPAFIQAGSSLFAATAVRAADSSTNSDSSTDAGITAPNAAFARMENGICEYLTTRTTTAASGSATDTFENWDSSWSSTIQRGTGTPWTVYADHPYGNPSAW